ncbi:CAAX prenyl protease 2-like [Zophobas morio]|uniref:CAAX prenyl protease 2-like n=1 Tax=Zophobas morio TaxID=2755281 RepID=UPI0030839CF6
MHSFITGLRTKEKSLKHSVSTCLGFSIDAYALASACVSLLLTFILFLGPVAKFYCDDCYINSITEVLKEARNCLYSSKFWRDYVVAPVTEEIIYRGCLFPLLAPTFGRNLYILINSIFFGLAHFHHLFEHRHLPWPSWKKKFHLSIMQSGFTFTFAIYNTYFYLCTGRILTPIVIHILCNAIGFPRFQEIASHPHRKGRN